MAATSVALKDEFVHFYSLDGMIYGCSKDCPTYHWVKGSEDVAICYYFENAEDCIAVRLSRINSYVVDRKTFTVICYVDDGYVCGQYFRNGGDMKLWIHTYLKDSNYDDKEYVPSSSDSDADNDE